MSLPDLERLRLLAELGRHQEAEQGLRALLAGEPGNAAALLMLADVLDDQGRYPEAEEAARRAVALAPDEEFAQRMLATVLAHNRKHDEAVAVAQAAVQLAPQDWATHYTLGMVLRGGRRPRTRDALDAANQAVRLAPHESAAHNLAGMCLSDLGLDDLAHRAYSEALRLDPQSTMALNNMAVHQLESGRLKDASGFLTAGLSTDAQEKILHQNYDAILYKLMRRLFWTEVGCAVLIGILAGTGAPWVYRILLGLAMVGAFVMITRGVLAGLPRGANRHALGLFRRTRGWMRYGVALFVLTTAAVLAMAMTPNDLSAAIGLGMLLLFRTLGVIVIVVLVVSGLVNLVRRMIGR